MRERTNRVERFWSKVAKSDGCWIWTGSLHKFGYGYFKLAGKVRLAHRLSYELSVGQIPFGLWVLHSCDNTSCVNPEHLHLGTQADNMRECKERGRTSKGAEHGARVKSRWRPVKGESNGLSKLTDAAVLQIRALHREGVARACVMAEQFGVSRPAISNVVNRKTWKHL